MTPYPADYGHYFLGALPYAGLEALRIAAWCVAAVALAAAGLWLLGKARRLARPPLSRRERDLPALSRAIGNVERRTRAMSIGDLVISGEVERYAAHKAGAPTEAIEVAPRDWDGLGDLDPDWRLGGGDR